jgi:hypothetical protein
MNLLFACLAAISLVCFVGIATIGPRWLAQRPQIAITVPQAPNVRNASEGVMGRRDVPYIFYHRDREVVVSMYDQLPQVAQQISTFTIEGKADKEVSLSTAHPFGAIRVGATKGSTTSATFEEDRNAYRMYRAVQNHLEDAGYVTAVDLVDGFDTAPIAGLIAHFIQLESDHGFPLLSGETDSLLERWREHQEKVGSQRLLKLNGTVAIRALYTLRNSPHDGTAVLVASSGTVHGVSVLVRFDGQSIGGPGCAKMIPDQPTELTCFGVVKHSDSANQELVIQPIAIYALTLSPCTRRRYMLVRTERPG